MIRLRNVEEFFEHGVSRTCDLCRINIDMQEAGFVCAMGPSGAGKSTVMRILGMYDAAWTGECHLLDRPVHELNKKERAELQNKYIGSDGWVISGGTSA